jgi:hypothetical protein
MLTCSHQEYIPWYSWNTAKVSVKHQSIKQSHHEYSWNTASLMLCKNQSVKVDRNYRL